MQLVDRHEIRKRKHVEIPIIITSIQKCAIRTNTRLLVYTHFPL